MRVNEVIENKMKYEIVHLTKEQWKGYILPIKYTTKQYYDVVINKREDGFNVNIEKKDFRDTVTHN